MSTSRQSGNGSGDSLNLAWSQVELESGGSPVSPGGALEIGSFPAVMEGLACFDNLLGSLMPSVC